MAAGEGEVMTDWSVLIEAAALNDNEPELDADAIDDLIAVLEDYSPAVSYGSHRWAIELSVEAPDGGAALSSAVELVYKAAEKAAVPRWPLVRVAVTSAVLVDTELSQSNIPTLVGVSEIAGLLGVSRQRASELARTADFPVPVASLASGPVWLEPAVLRFAKSWTRRPGRPRARGSYVVTDKDGAVLFSGQMKRQESVRSASREVIEMASQRRTSAKAAKAASSVLRDGRTSSKSKTAAASALSQRAPKGKRSK